MAVLGDIAETVQTLIATFRSEAIEKRLENPKKPS
jgi:hypothetical protein